MDSQVCHLIDRIDFSTAHTLCLSFLFFFVFKRGVLLDFFFFFFFFFFWFFFLPFLFGEMLQLFPNERIIFFFL